MNSKTKKTQLQTILYYLQDHTSTASMISKATGIPQKNITRYKADLEKKGLLKEVIKRKCKVTGFSAWYLSTNIIRQVPSVLQEIRNAKKENND